MKPQLPTLIFTAVALLSSAAAVASGTAGPREARALRDEIYKTPSLALAPNGVSELKSDCRFTPLGRTYDLVLRAPTRVGRLGIDNDGSFQRVSLLVNDSLVIGHVATECLKDPRSGELTSTHSLMARELYPSQLSSVATSSEPLADFQVLGELREASSAELRTQLKSFLATTQIRSVDLLRHSRPESPFELGPRVVQAAFEVTWEILAAARPACEQVPNALRLLQIAISNGNELGADPRGAMLVLYALVFGSERAQIPCAVEVQANLGSLLLVSLPRPVNPFVEDQRWKKAWTGATDEEMERALSRKFGTRVRVLRDDGDPRDEKRWVATLPQLGTLEEVVYELEPPAGRFGVEYRWVSGERFGLSDLGHRWGLAR